MGGAALACIGLACAWTLCVNLAGPGAGWSDPDAVADGHAASAGTRGDRLAVVRPQPQQPPARSPAANIYAMLFDPQNTLGFSPGTFAKRAAAVVADSQPQAPAAAPHAAPAQVAAATPPRGDRVAQNPAAPPPHAQPLRTASLRDSAHDRAAASVPDKPPSIFERLFGKPAAPVTLAYASPDDAGIAAGANIASGRYDRETAVYDITARVVYMPDGTKLEAHSGLGARLDDPRHADERNRGVTPPTVYDLEPREAPFHGVHALRLIPEDDSKVFGRTGLLAHSFMMGPNGDSNGCVSFRDYEAFLRAYERHQIKRLAVVEHAE